MSHSSRLASLVEQIDRGDNVEQARREAAELIQDIAPEELVRIEEELVEKGMPADKVRHLCCSHMQASAGQRDAFRNRLPEGHMVATLMDEHTHILAKLERLEGLVGEVGDGAPTPENLKEVEEIAGFLIGTEPHHQREEQVLFPMLISRGIAGPPGVMIAEHVELRTLKHCVEDGARALLQDSAADWSMVRMPALQLVGMLRDHIFKEDNILYPMALQAIPQADVWVEARTRADAVGYCCQQPAD